MLYIGKFLHMTNQQSTDESERRHGEFNLIVQAPNSKAAVEFFKERIIDSRENSDLFEGDCSIYFVHLLEMEEFPSKRAKMFVDQPRPSFAILGGHLIAKHIKPAANHLMVNLMLVHPVKPLANV